MQLKPKYTYGGLRFHTLPNESWERRRARAPSRRWATGVCLRDSLLAAQHELPRQYQPAGLRFDKTRNEPERSPFVLTRGETSNCRARGRSVTYRRAARR